VIADGPQSRSRTLCVLSACEYRVRLTQLRIQAGKFCRAAPATRAVECPRGVGAVPGHRPDLGRRARQGGEAGQEWLMAAYPGEGSLCSPGMIQPVPPHWQTTCGAPLIWPEPPQVGQVSAVAGRSGRRARSSGYLRVP